MDEVNQMDETTTTETMDTPDAIDVLAGDPVEAAALICSAMASTIAMSDPGKVPIAVALDAMMAVWDALDVDYQGPQWKLAFGMQCQAVIVGKITDSTTAWAAASSTLRQPGVGQLAVLLDAADDATDLVDAVSGVLGG